MKLGLGRGVVLKKTPFEHPATLPQAAAPPPPPPTANLPLPVLRPMFARRVVQPESAHAADPQ